MVTCGIDADVEGSFGGDVPEDTKAASSAPFQAWMALYPALSLLCGLLYKRVEPVEEPA